MEGITCFACRECKENTEYAKRFHKQIRMKNTNNLVECNFCSIKCLREYETKYEQPRIEPKFHRFINNFSSGNNT